MRQILLIILLISLPLFAAADDVSSISMPDFTDQAASHDPNLPDPRDPEALAAFFQPSTHDVSMNLLESIFGTVGTLLHGNALIMGEMFEIFNLAVLSLAGLVLIYILFISILNCSYEGNMMREHHSMWGPLRTVVAIGLMIPGSSGYNGMQVIVMWVVKQGIGAADRIWEVTVDHVMEGESILQKPFTPDMVVSQFSATSGEDTSGNMGTRAGQLLSAVSCMRGMQTILQQQRDREMNRTDKKAPFKGSCQPVDGKIKDGNFWCYGDYPDFIRTVDVIKAQTAVLSSNNPAKQVTVHFPTFDKDPNLYPLDGICGSMTFNIVDRDEAKNQLGNTFGEGGTTGKLNQLEMARGLAVQQMYLDMSNLGRMMFSNEANFSNLSSSRMTLPLGEPLDNNTIWGVRGGGAFLLNGGELWDATRDYYNILTPTLNLLKHGVSRDQADSNVGFANYFGAQYLSSGGVSPNTSSGYATDIYPANQDTENVSAFATQAKNDGWILAGSYYWNVANANRKQDEFYNDLDNFTINTSSVQTMGNGVGNGALSNAIENGALTTGQLALLGGYLGNQPNNDFEENNTVNKYIQNAIQYGFNNGNQVQERSPGLVDLANISMGIDTNSASGDLGSIIKSIQNSFHFSGGLFGWKSIFSMIVSVLLSVISLAMNLLIVATNAIIQTIIAMFAEEISNLVQQVEDIINQDMNPLVGLAQLGNILVNTSVTLWTDGMVLMVALMAGSATVLAGLMGIVAFVLPAIGTVILLLFSSGILLAYYLPLLPYFIFTLGGIAWLIGVIEAMCAAPIVAMGLMYPEGHKVFGYAGDKTIMLLLNVFLRPAMMVIGFIGSMLLASAGVKLINMGFHQALVAVVGHTSDGFSSAIGVGQNQVSGVSGLVGVLMVVCIYVYLIWTVVEKSCQLIYLIPDKVLRWIGSGFEESLGQGTSGMVESMKSGMQSGGGQFGQGLKGMAEGSGDSPIQTRNADMFKSKTEVKPTGGGAGGGG